MPRGICGACPAPADRPVGGEAAFPTRASVQETEAYAEYLSRKPAMADIVAMAGWINPRNQNPAYDACANLWRTALYEIFNNNAPIQETLDQLAVEIQETLDDQ